MTCNLIITYPLRVYFHGKKLKMMLNDTPGTLATTTQARLKIGW